jgi:hypothetical protein
MSALITFLAGIDWKTVVTLSLPVVSAAVGWVYVHRLNSARDLETRRREARLKALEAAFMRLATASNRTLTDPLMDQIETFVSELQLYGTPRQVELMGKLVEALRIPNNLAKFDELLIDLRDGIRNELRLEKLPPEIWWFRFHRQPSPGGTASPNDG